jgi:hypothetical protein
MANSAYASGFNTDALFVPVKAATIYAAHESSLFIGGEMIPVVQAPNGVVQVPELASVSATNLSTEAAPGVDLETVLPADTKNTISCEIYAARSVVRDLGAIDPAEIGRSLGNAVSAAFDADVAGVMGSLTGQEITSGDLDMAEVAAAVGTIRAAGETGPLMGVVGASSYAALMNDIGGTAFAGGDLFQGQALRSGFFGTLMGVQVFVSSYLNDTNTGVTGSKMAIFGKDAMRIAMQKNIDLEIARRAEAVGNDVVASLHAKAALIDAARGVLIKDAA